MKRFILLVLASAIAAPVLADDLIPAWWANDGYGNRIQPTGSDPCNPLRYMGPSGLGGTTYSEWTYDDPCGVYSFDPPETSWYVSHPDYEDPLPIDPCLPYFSAQQWGSDDDPCNPDWSDLLPSGRQGGVNFGYGSWDLNNFVLPWQPGPGELMSKDLWVQITYFTGGDATDWSFELEGLGQILLEGELVPVADPCQLAEGLWHTAFDISVLAPDMLTTESLSLYTDVPVIIDQIIIESYQYGLIIPEPATMLLFGVGGLLMIRRSRYC
jgi:hypothetical protein